MSTEQCGSLSSNGKRCDESPAPSTGSSQPISLPLAAAAEPDPMHPNERLSSPEIPFSRPDTPRPSSVSPCLRGDPDRTGWLLALLQEAMTGVMGGDATPLQKANAVARLTALYLKACHVAGLEQANAALAERAAAAEAYTADLEARATAWAERLGEAVTAEAPQDEPDQSSGAPEEDARTAERALLVLLGAPACLLRGTSTPEPADLGGALPVNGRRPETVPAGRRAPP